MSGWMTDRQGDQLCDFSCKKTTFSAVLQLFATFMQIASKSVLQLDIRLLALVLSFRAIFTSIESRLSRV